METSTTIVEIRLSDCGLVYGNTQKVHIVDELEEEEENHEVHEDTVEDPEALQMLSLGLPATFTTKKRGRSEETLDDIQTCWSEDFLEEVSTAVKSQKNNKRKKKKSKGKKRKLRLPPGISEKVFKYWHQRYSFFSNFDEGIQMDEEGWFSVTPEVIAKHHAHRSAGHVVVDAFTGVGGNAIQFALKGQYVIAIDNNPARIAIARHNAEVYGVSDLIEFITGDFFVLAPRLKADAIFLSPPWGGPEYCRADSYDIQTMLQPKDGVTLLKAAQAVAPNIALYLPRNVDLEQVSQVSLLLTPPLKHEVEKNFLNDNLKAITVYFSSKALM